MSFAPGQLLAFYEISGPLGAGGMGEVWRARDTRLERDVAIKVLPEALHADPERRARLLREARAVAQLTHAHIARIYDVGEVDGRDYIAFELVHGRTLLDALGGRGMALEPLLACARALAEALAYAHSRGVVHRDIKAANVMLEPDGRPKLVDFGLAKVASSGSPEASNLTLEGAVFGTPGAMSPEQALGRPLDERSDVFSFGSLLFEMATGRPAFGGGTVMEVIDAVIHAEPPPLAQLRPDLPDGLGKLIERAMRKEPDERTASMGVVARELARLDGSEDGHRPARRTPGSRLQRARAGVALGAVLVAVLTWALFGRGTAPASAPGTGHVAVLFFDGGQASAEAAQLGDMLPHLLTTELSRDAQLSVLSQQRLSETARHAGNAEGRVDPANAGDVARAAGVATLVVGHVERVGRQWVATASASDVRSGRQLASGRALGESVDDVFTMAESLGASLRASLATAGEASAPQAQGLDHRVTNSVEAYRAFLDGFRSMQKQDFETACARFAAATELDAGFAQAYFWDAVASAWSGRRERQARSIERAAAFRERLPPDEARALPAAEHYHHARFLEALPELETLVSADPGNRDAWYMLGEVLLHSPANADATRAAGAFERVLAIDDLFGLVGEHVTAAWCLAGDLARAREWNERLGRTNARDAWIRDSTIAMWSGDEAAVRRARDERPSTLAREDPFVRITDLGLLQSMLAFGPLPERESELFERELSSQAESNGNRVPSQRTWVVCTLHELLLFYGRFDEAVALEPRMPSRPESPGRNGFDEGCLANAQIAFALRRELLGDAAGALERLQALTAEIEAPRVRWQAVALALRLGRADAAEDQLAALDALVERGALRAPYYRDLARAEAALARGEFARARAVFEQALAPELVLQDVYAYGWPVLGRVLDGCWRAARASGDEADELAVVQRIVACRNLRAEDPGLWRRAQAELGRRELEGVDPAAGRARLEDFLAAWGTSGAALDEVQRARDALARAR